ncbi:hypothetical protein R1flu_004046 [Riccia fluitans]|uniref:Uncharacterized protein n=1 Tax=Riccia fluitans TaxID=41844 RepID=A0ABD1YP71_9MARC
MGHYRPHRPKRNEDPMKGVEHLYDTVGKIKEGKFRGFSHWTKGVPTPELHAQRRLGRLRALNHGVEPRLGVSVFEARNHSRYINAMVERIENLHTPRMRSKDSTNVNMYPVYLRRPLRKETPSMVKVIRIEQTPQKKKRKKRNNWTEPTVTLPRDQPIKELAPAHYPKAVRKHRLGEKMVRQDTPLCYTPRPETKLIDGTHLCNRYNYNDSESRKKFFSGEDVDRVKREYREVMKNPQGLATLTTKTWTPPAPPVSTYDPQWRIDMRLADLPSDLQATPSHHTQDDPVRPSSSRRAEENVFVEQNWNWSPRPVQCNTPRNVPCDTPRTVLPGKYSTKESPRVVMRPECSPRALRRPECSSLKHVHLADLKASFRERLRNSSLAVVSNSSFGTQAFILSRPANPSPLPANRPDTPWSQSSLRFCLLTPDLRTAQILQPRPLSLEAAQSPLSPH